MKLKKILNEVILSENAEDDFNAKIELIFNATHEFNWEDPGPVIKFGRQFKEPVLVKIGKDFDKEIKKQHKKDRMSMPRFSSADQKRIKKIFKSSLLKTANDLDKEGDKEGPGQVKDWIKNNL